MKMKNKIELKKAIIACVCVILIMDIIFVFIYNNQYKTYTKNFNYKINQIVEKINSKYPNIEKTEIIQILNSTENMNNYLLKEYGIDIKKEAVILENDKYFKNFLILNIIIITILGFMILFILLKYNYIKDKKLKQITNYIEDINNKNYKLDIEDNTQDELSILKNEVYKTTVMLKEMAENSKQDKINLKDSLSDISHQLKTPLTSIEIMLDNILDNPQMDNETKLEFIKDIKKQTININFLVNSLLKLSKFDTNSIKFINKTEKVEDIINKSIKNVESICDLKNIEIKVQGQIKSKINCDIKWQVEAITNILKNAIEHSNENSKININYEQNNVYTKIEITDFGKGINKEDLPHIFERFYKGKNSSSESCGIGLALAKTIIENNGGYVQVESEENKKTTFVIKYVE